VIKNGYYNAEIWLHTTNLSQLIRFLSIVLLFNKTSLLKKIFNTTSIKFASNLLMLLVLWLTVKFLGETGRGEIAIFNVNLAFVILLNGFVGSSVIVYLTPRIDFYKLIIPSYAWALISSLLSPILLQHFFVLLEIQFEIDTFTLGLQNTNYYFLLVVCAITGSFFEINHLVLLGKNKLNQANWLNFARNLAIVALLIIAFYSPNASKNAYGYFLSLTSAHVIGFGISAYLVLKMPSSGFGLAQLWVCTKELVKLGLTDQCSNLLQFLNKRLPMYVLFLSFGKASTGVLSVAVTLSEAFLFLSQGIATVQYAHIANSQNRSNDVLISQKLFRLSFMVLGLALISLCLVPNIVWSWLFHNTLAQLSSLLAVMALGIVSFGTSYVLNHYFSGIGQFYQNVYSNLAALVVTILGCIYLIPTYGMLGAALTTSFSYFVLLTYLVFAFLRQSNQSVKQLFPQKTDFTLFWKMLFK
jgi:O-antigen/teichoic acid export membrane protein